MKPQDFVHLHVHSHYSLLDGLAKPDDLIKKAKNFGMSFLAITDHGAMYGVSEFFKKCEKEGIKPIIGVETYIAPRTYKDKVPKIDSSPYHLILIAENNTGYKNLLKLVTMAHLEGYYYRPRIDKKILSEHSEGLIGLTACLQGEIPRAILAGKISKAEKLAKEYGTVFGKDNFFLELQHHPNIADQKKVNQALIKIGKKLNIPLVVTEDVHYTNSEDQEAHEALLCVQTGKFLSDKDRMSMADDDFSFKNPAEIIKAFATIPEALENTKKIAQRCRAKIEYGKIIIPKFHPPRNFTISEYFKYLAYKGLILRYGKGALEDIGQKEKITAPDIKKIREAIGDGLVDRLRYEMKVISDMGFESYFLIVADFVTYAKGKGIMVGPGRGSIAGSLVAYCLNISDLDPIGHGLMFERFLNPGRISMPDADLDFADDRRGEVIDYVVKKYGQDHVAQIITFGTMMARNSIRDTGRVLGVSYGDVDKVAKMIPFNMTLAEALKAVPELKEAYQGSEKVKKLYTLAQKLEGCVRHASMHAAGVVIGDKPLVNYLPIQFASRGDIATVTQYSMYEIEAMGLLKMDFLGLANLSIIQNALKIIEKTRGESLDIKNIPMDDPESYRLLQRAETVGVFQLESEGMRRNLKELRPTEFDDIVAMVALYRPGPMELIPDYIAGKHGRKKPTYLNPKLEPILKDTYGIAVYQEQVLQIARDLAGFTLSEADTLRKAIGKKIKELLLEQKEKFINGCVKQGIDKKIATQLFEFVEPFARYGFNKAHAACYAQIAYETAYLKAHYPAEFMAALLTSDNDNMDRIAIEVAESERKGIKVLPPDINESFVNFTVIDPKTIRFGLGAIKNVGEGAIENIVNSRKEKGKFISLEDFASRINSFEVNKKVLESLIKSGAMDSLGERGSLLVGVENILKFASKLNKQKENGQVDLFAGLGEGANKPANLSLELPEVEAVPKKQRLSWEKELLGIYISEHPLTSFAQFLAEQAHPIVDLDNKKEGEKVKIGGIITKIQRIMTRNGAQMLFVRVEDTADSVEILVFPSLLEQSQESWREDNIVLIEGKLSVKEGEPKILADRVEEVNQTSMSQIKKVLRKTLHLTVPKEGGKKVLIKIKELFEQFSGEMPVIIHIPNQHESRSLRVRSRVIDSEELLSELREFLGKDKVVVEIKEEGT